MMRVQLSWEVHLLEGSGTLGQKSGIECNAAMDNLFLWLIFADRLLGSPGPCCMKTKLKG